MAEARAADPPAMARAASPPLAEAVAAPAVADEIREYYDERSFTVPYYNDLADPHAPCNLISIQSSLVAAVLPLYHGMCDARHQYHYCLQMANGITTHHVSSMLPNDEFSGRVFHVPEDEAEDLTQSEDDDEDEDGEEADEEPAPRRRPSRRAARRAARGAAAAPDDGDGDDDDDDDVAEETILAG